MSNDINLGKLITNENAERDAVHVAIIPLIAGEYLNPGDKFKLKYGTKDVALRAGYNREDEIHGIVDPFLPGWEVQEGDRFWGILMPNTVTGMRHHWEHPVFDVVAQETIVKEQLSRSDAEIWIHEFCDEWNFDWDQLIEAATGKGDWRFVADWRYVVARGVDLHSSGELGEDHDLFWKHLEVLMETKYDDAHKEGMGWSCSC